MQAKKDMPKRYRMNLPDLAQAVAVELCGLAQDVKSQQRLLAASGQMTAVQIAEPRGISHRRFFDWMNALKAGGLPPGWSVSTAAKPGPKCFNVNFP